MSSSVLETELLQVIFYNIDYPAWCPHKWRKAYIALEHNWSQNVTF